jgi:ABC-2 type transport system permease protein
MIERLKALILKDLRISLSYRFQAVLQAAGWAFTLVLWFFIARLFNGAMPAFASQGGYFPYVLLGIILQSMLTSALYDNAARIRDQQLTGTLEYTLNLLPRPSLSLLAGMVTDFTVSFVRMILLIAGAALLFGFPVGHLSVLPALAAVALSALTFGAIGNLSAATVVWLKRGDPIAYFFTTFSALLGTVFFPKDVMPKGLQIAADFVPTTHALAAMRGAVLEGKGFSDLAPHFLILTAFAAVLFPASLWAFDVAVRKGKKDGTLGQF